MVTLDQSGGKTKTILFGKNRFIIAKNTLKNYTRAP